MQFIHLVEFLADETFGKRVLDVVTAMDGKEEVIQSCLHVSLVVCLDSIMILFVCLTLCKSRMDGALVVVMTGKLLDFVADEYLALANRFLQADSFQTGAT